MKHRFPPDCPKSLNDLIGRKVKTKRDMSNANIRIPAGAVLEVAYSNRWEDLKLQAAACECCGIAPYIGGVSIGDVTIVKGDDLLTKALAS